MIPDKNPMQRGGGVVLVPYNRKTMCVFTVITLRII